MKQHISDKLFLLLLATVRVSLEQDYVQSLWSSKGSEGTSPPVCLIVTHPH